MLSGSHKIAKEASSMDRVRKSFVGRMKATTELRHSVYNQGFDENVTTSTGSVIMTTFKQRGWALPIRSNFKYSAKQKSLLYKYFIAGKKSGEKISPEQVQLLFRKVVQKTEEYVTSQQIRSLFSRWSSLQRQGQLKAPTDYVSSETVEPEEDEVEGEETSDVYHNYLVEVACDCMIWKVNEWVAFVYKNKWYPGSITTVNEDTVKVNAMHCTMMGKNNFKWPTRKDEISYQHDDILCVIDPPKPSNQHGDFCLADNDFSNVNTLFHKF